MNVHEITLNVPGDLYELLRQKAKSSKQALDEVALQSLRAGMPPSLNHVPQRFHTDLQALDQMSDGMLQQIAHADLPNDKAALYESLLEKNGRASLNQEEQATLNRLREEADLLMLRRAYAYTLLKWRGHRIPSLAELNAS
jgi:hypothetical protein